MTINFFGITILCSIFLASCHQNLSKSLGFNDTDKSKDKIIINLNFEGSIEFQEAVAARISPIIPPIYLNPPFFTEKFLIKKLPERIELDASVIRGSSSNITGYHLELLDGVDEYLFHTALNNASFEDDGKTLNFLIVNKIGGDYFRSKDTLFYGNAKIEGCDSETFEIIDSYHGLSRDKNRVYNGSRPIADADPQTFRVLDGQYYRDARWVFHSSTKIATPDPDKFVVLRGGLFAKDDTRIYLDGVVLEGADVASFSVISGGYAKDNTKVFYFTELLTNANPQTFRSAGAGAPFPNLFAVDGTKVYYRGHIFPVSNPAAFRTFDFDVDLRNVPPHYATDGTMVYFDDTPMPEVDTASFQVLIAVGDVVMGRDKNRYYVGLNPGSEADYRQLLIELESRGGRPSGR